jgi:thiamine-phosphate pyrophosphorylase
MRGLYALTSGLTETRVLASKVRAALAGGASAIQYRNKEASAALRLEQAMALRDISAGVPLIINDDVELAAAVAADGVHLGRDDAGVAAARARLGRRALIGVSCYDSLERAQAAVDAGADYIAFGSFYGSRVKPDAVRAPRSLLSEAKRRWRVAVVAIGGITPDNAPLLLAAGADAIAVISALFDADDVEAAARCFSRMFDPAPAR